MSTSNNRSTNDTDDVLGAGAGNSTEKDPDDWVTGDEPMTEAQKSYLDTLAKEAGVSLSVVDGLIDDGALEALALAPEPVALPPDPDHARVPLSEAQEAAVRELVALMNPGPAEPAPTDAIGDPLPADGKVAPPGVAHKAPTVLLEGVTGSGKTEVYFEAVADCVRRGHQALILMPEIALTAQFLDRFAERFGDSVCVYHSGLADGAKRTAVLTAIAQAAPKTRAKTAVNELLRG